MQNLTVNSTSQDYDLPTSEEMIPIFENLMRDLARGPVGDNKWFTRHVLASVIYGIKKYRVDAEEKWIKATEAWNNHPTTHTEISLKAEANLFRKKDFWEYQANHFEALESAVINVYNQLVKDELLYESYYTGEIVEFSQWGEYKKKPTEDVTDVISSEEKKKYLEENKTRLDKIRREINSKKS